MKKVFEKYIAKLDKRYYLAAGIIFLILFYAVLYKIYMPRLNAFGCFDDCNNFMGGYFLLQGKRLFSEIFFNHNPGMAYISWLVQFLAHPQNLYELILRHRQALLIFSLGFNLLLFVRFGFPILFFALFYELTKFYLFGDRFLAEGFIVYPLIYLTGLGFLKVSGKNILAIDYIFAGIFTWFIVFMREPYVPVTLILFAYLLWNKKNIKKSTIAFCVFFVLSFITLALHDVKEFFFNVVTANVGLATSETTNIGLTLFKSFFYPFFIFFDGEWGYFRYLQVFLDLLFLASCTFLILKKRWKIVLLIFFTLGLLDIRYVEPGKAFYAAFHLLCWYGVFLFASFYFVAQIYKDSKKFAVVLGAAYLGVIVFHIFSPSSFFYGKADPHRELLVNYGPPMQVGMVINSLSTPSDTLFLDGSDDIIYWQAQRYSTYKYSWYTSLMPNFKKYTDERLNMFRTNPPDYYYGSCPQEANPDKLLPIFVKDKYIRLYTDKKPSCVWIKKTKLSSISAQQWDKAKSYFYYLPEIDR